MADWIDSQKLNPQNRFLGKFVKFTALENFVLYGTYQQCQSLHTYSTCMYIAYGHNENKICTDYIHI